MSEPPYLTIFLPTACNPCLSKPYAVKQDKLSKCLGCKLILYCSVGHQKGDWRFHRDFCRAISAILTRHSLDHVFHLNGQIKNQSDLHIVTLMIKYIVRTLLNRQLNYYEEQLISYPIMCAVCYSTDMSKLFQCKQCRAISFCSEEHEKQYSPIHKTECEPFKIHYCKYKINPVPPIAEDLRWPCSLLGSDLATVISEMFGIKLPDDPTRKAADYLIYAQVSDFSCIATIAYVMGHLDMSTFLGDQFTIYVVGSVADDIYFAEPQLWFFFALFLRIKKLNLIFVGPEIRFPLKEKQFKIDEERIVSKIMHRGKLEDYYANNPSHRKPNLIVCYNCGFSEHAAPNSTYDPWYNALRHMVEMPDMPIIFTSYTSLEADFDFGCIVKVVDDRKSFNNMRLERIITKQENPYKDLRPIRMWDFNVTDKIFYRNGFLQAVRVKPNDNIA